MNNLSSSISTPSFPNSVLPIMVKTLEIPEVACDDDGFPCLGHKCIITLKDGLTTGIVDIDTLKICSLIRSLASNKIINNSGFGIEHFTQYGDDDFDLDFYVGLKELPSAESILTTIFFKLFGDEDMVEEVRNLRRELWLY